MTDLELSVDVERDESDFKKLTKVLWDAQNVQAYRLLAGMTAAILVGTTHEWLSELPWVQKHIFYEYGAFYMAAGVGVFFLAAMALYRIMARNVQYIAPNQNFLRPRRFITSDQGVKELTEVTSSFYSWRAFSDIRKTNDAILLYIDRMQAVVIPLRSFPSRAVADEFHKHILALWTRMKDSQPKAA